MVSPELLKILICVVCRGDLDHVENPEQLICQACRRAYPVRDDIPIMLEEEATIDGQPAHLVAEATEQAATQGSS